MVWTQFYDRSSGGTAKAGFKSCFIEAPEGEARKLFMEAFSQHPDHEACSCCGADWSVMEWDTLEEATQLERNVALLNVYHQRPDPEMSMADFLADPHYVEFGRRHEVVLMFSDGKIVLPVSR